MGKITLSRPTIEITLLASVILLVGIGYGFLYSASSPIAEKYFSNSYYFLIKQGIYLLISIVGFIMAILVDYNFYKNHIKIIVFFTFLILILTLIPGIGKEVNGARRWISINLIFDKFQFQPSEIAKLTIIFYLASLFSHKEEYIKDFYKGVLPPLIIVFLMGFLILLQNDFSTAFLFLITSFFIFFLAGTQIITLILLSLIGGLTTFFMIVVAPYRAKRILAFLNPWEDPLGSGWHYIQSMRCIVSGKWLGKGIGESTQKYFNLPEAHTDYIFGIITEEGGVILAVVIIFLYLVFAIIGLNIAKKAPCKYSFIVASGITLFIFFQAMINIAVVMGALPATGITLPFVSSGGTSLLVSFYGVGILLNISLTSKKERKVFLEKEKSERFYVNKL